MKRERAMAYAYSNQVHTPVFVSMFFIGKIVEIENRNMHFIFFVKIRSSSACLGTRPEIISGIDGVSQVGSKFKFYRSA